MTFFQKIKKFNKMYNMPENGNFDWQERLNNFKSILDEEANEIYDLEPHNTPDINFKTGLADLLGDIIVYCASEAERWGIDIEQVLDIIMESNFSKLDANGMPIYDERGKLMKGPSYWKPEEKIKELLEKEKK